MFKRVVAIVSIALAVPVASPAATPSLGPGMLAGLRADVVTANVPVAPPALRLTPALFQKRPAAPPRVAQRRVYRSSVLCAKISSSATVRAVKPCSVR